jgi:hypothetical protein
MPQTKPRATLVSKYNAGVSTLCLFLLFKLVVIVNGLSIEHAGLVERVKSIEEKANGATTSVNYIRQDVAGLSGIVTSQGNRITHIEAILPNKKQFDVKN